MARCEADGVNFNTPMYKWMIDRLQQVFVMVSMSVNVFVSGVTRMFIGLQTTLVEFEVAFVIEKYHVVG